MGVSRIMVFFQYRAQTEKLQQQLALEKGVYLEVRLHEPWSRSGMQAPGELLGPPQKTSTLQAEPFWPPHPPTTLTSPQPSK